MGQSIQDMHKNIKQMLSDDVYFYTALVILVSVLSFGLGRMSLPDASVTHEPQVVLQEQSASAAVSLPVEQSVDVAQQLVASKKGTKYHLLTCPGAKQMNDDNKIYFASEAEAKAAGYTKAGNCKF